MAIAYKLSLLVIEDAAQGVGAYNNNRALGTIGHLGTYSFHETKNYICGEGGLCINYPGMIKRAEIIRDKGTKRSEFFLGKLMSPTLVDIGSSYVPSEIACAFFYAQLEMLDSIAERRKAIYKQYRML